MRTSLVLAAALLASGCTPGELSYDHTAELSVASRGIAYTDDDNAQVGMNGLTCAVDPDTSIIGEDVDVVDEDDQLEDSKNGEALVINSTGVTVYDPFNFEWSDAHDIAAPSLEAAGFALTGIVTLDSFQGCTVTVHGDEVQSYSIGALPCDGAKLATTPALDTVVVAASGSATLISETGEVLALGSGDHVALDGRSGLAYAATGARLAAYELDGTLAWETELSAPAHDLQMIGDHAAVLLAHPNGSGELVTIDNMGLQSSSLVTPTPAESLAASASGRELAMVLPFEVHFFEVNAL